MHALLILSRNCFHMTRTKSIIMRCVVALETQLLALALALAQVAVQRNMLQDIETRGDMQRSQHRALQHTPYAQDQLEEAIVQVTGVGAWTCMKHALSKLHFLT